MHDEEPERGAELSIHATAAASAAGDPHAQFSQSIAERVVATSEPIITMSAKDDARLLAHRVCVSVCLLVCHKTQSQSTA